MFKYKVYMGYQKKGGLGFPYLGEIEYPYPLIKGDTIILSNRLFEELSKYEIIQSGIKLSYRQQYTVGGLHHWIDKENPIVDIYLVMDNDYKK